MKFTDIETIPSVVSELRSSFEGGKLHSVDYRLHQLRNLYYALDDNSQLLVEALEEDFHRANFETVALEVSVVKAELSDIISNLKKWAKGSKLYRLPFSYMTTSTRVEKIPYGVVLIISPFNYPLSLSMSPVAGAIAAGNCVVLKPAESTPAFSEALSKVLENALDPGILSVVKGGPEETTKVLQQRFDKIMYTGGDKVGKIVARAAAEHLTPTLMELGGKSPGIITASHANLDTIIKRIVWGRYVNAGQTCVALDYLLVEDKVYDAVVSKLVEIVNDFFPQVDVESNFTHIINKPSFDRLLKILETTKGEVVCGGKSDAAHLFIEPTVVTKVGWDDPLMSQEIFGPILPVIPFSNLANAVDLIKSHWDTPLASYIFSQDEKERQYILANLRSGGTCINETVMHVGLSKVPFGGIGSSGYGNYHGKTSFDAFSHERTVMSQSLLAEPLLKARYPPYTLGNLKVMKFMMTSSPTFSRTGPVTTTPWVFIGSMAAIVAAVLYLFI